MSTPHHDLPGVDAVQPVDPDLAEQAVPGHGIPSQDPAGAAQVGLLPEEAQREANRVRRTKVSYDEIIRIIT